MTTAHSTCIATLFVAPHVNRDSGCGTSDEPFGSVDKALMHAAPGTRIILKNGSYTGDITIQTSGTLELPITLAAEEPGLAILDGGSLYLYDASDIVITGLTFRTTLAQAISVVGTCERNAFTGLHFIDCGRNSKSGCTFFIGGSGGSCTMVADCTFEVSRVPEKGIELPIALMIAEGDTEEGAAPNLSLVVKNNRFVNYGCAIVLGTQGGSTVHFGHRVEANTIGPCGSDGMRIKCGDVQILDNCIFDCGGSGIVVRDGLGSNIESNRVENCAVGIDNAASGTTIQNNCILGSHSAALRIHGGAHSVRGTMAAVNTCVAGAAPAIILEGAAECVVEGNILLSSTAPVLVRDAHADHPWYAVGNAVTTGFAAHGLAEWEPSFADPAKGDYTVVDASFGAQGWMAQGRTIHQTVAEESDPDPLDDAELDDETAPELDPEKAYDRALFFGMDGVDEEGFESDDDDDMGEDDNDNAPRDEDGIRNYSDYDE